MSDLKAPTYKNLSLRGGATHPRRSGLYGPTAILSRSDIFKRQWHTKDVGPEGTDLQIPIPSRVRGRSPVGRAFTVRHVFFRAATFSKGIGAANMSDLKAPTGKYRSLTGSNQPVRCKRP